MPAPATWSTKDFAAVFQFLSTAAELLRDSPESFVEYTDILRQDCADAQAALAKISEAVGLTT